MIPGDALKIDRLLWCFFLSPDLLFLTDNRSEVDDISSKGIHTEHWKFCTAFFQLQTSGFTLTVTVLWILIPVLEFSPFWCLSHSVFLCLQNCIKNLPQATVTLAQQVLLNSGGYLYSDSSFQRWNSLPSDICHTRSFYAIKAASKTHLKLQTMPQQVISDSVFFFLPLHTPPPPPLAPCYILFYIAFLLQGSWADDFPVFTI